ncbi:MAG: LamG-like jellyroll fold domain-containing protein [Candidatus Micrarchaeia archaeon]
MFFLLFLPSFSSAFWWNSSWAFRKQITVMNNNATNSLLAGSSVNFSLNHSQLVVSNKSLGNGSDVRITWYNSSSASEVELDRVLEPNGLVGLWHFDDGSGQTLTDSSGNNNDGVITESTWNSSGRAGGSALSFDGVNDMVTISSLQNTDFPQTAGTIAFWVKGEYEGQDAKSLFDDYDGSRNHIFMRVRNTSSLLYFQVQWMNTTPAYIAGASIYVENDEWVFVTLTYNTSSDSAKTYINGTLRDSDTMTDTSWVPDGQFVRLAGAINFFNGSMDEMAIYNRDLSDVEVNALYQAGLKGHGVSKGFALENSTLWFKTKADISASSNDSNYYVYYNNSGADSAPVNTSAVFQKIDLSDELDNGLVSFWHMDEGSGQFLNDSGSGNNNGTLGANSGSASDDPAWQNENSSIDGLQTNFSSGSQLHFDGSNDYVLVQDNPVFHWEDGEVTAAMWIKPRNLSTTPIFFTKTDYNSGYWNGFDIRLQSSKVRVVTNATSDRDVWGTTVLEENTWYHVAVTIDNTNAKIYLNGNEDATESTVAYNLTNTLNLYIGSYNSPDYFLNGSIDEVALWNRSLSASEIKALYERRKHLVPLWTSSLGIETDNDSPSFSFVSPSDSDGAGVSRNYSYVNVSTTDVSLTSAFIDWNKSLVGYQSMPQ